jgi:hypothetical protein
MDNVWMMPIMAVLVLGPAYISDSLTQWMIFRQQQNSAYAQVVSEGAKNNVTASTSNLIQSVEDETEPSFITAVIVISKGIEGNVTYSPSNLTVKQSEEILLVNNDTNVQSMTNGMGPNDPLAGKLFDTGPIPPGGFAEYVASNLSPGNYSFYSSNSSSARGVLTIEPAN